MLECQLETFRSLSAQHFQPFRAVLQATKEEYCSRISGRYPTRCQRQQDCCVQRYRRVAASYGWGLRVRSAVDGSSCTHGEAFIPIRTTHDTRKAMLKPARGSHAVDIHAATITSS